MLRKRTPVPYWMQFQKYQSFTSLDHLKKTVSLFEQQYVLTKSMKAVLNTIKLHSKNFVGVCWLFREEISKKSGFSLSSVDRAIEAFCDAGLLKVVHWMNDKRGGQSHNIYVFQDVFSLNDDVHEELDEQANEEANEEASTPEGQASNPCGSKVDDDSVISYKDVNRNSHKNPNKNLNTKDFKIDNIEKGSESNLNVVNEPDQDKHITLKHVPEEFVAIMNPFYGHEPEIILARWKSTCVAIKRSCEHIGNTSWERISDVWKVVVNKLKRGLIHKVTQATTKKESEDAIGGYYYSLLCDYLLNDYLKAVTFAVSDDLVQSA